MEKQQVTVYKTKDYRIFRFLDGNRNPRSVKKIIDSINKIGYISSPLLCNERLEIIDGQNRFLALSELNLPVEYYIVKGIGLKEAIQLNIGQTNWTMKDYVNSYMTQGIIDYIWLEDLTRNLFCHGYQEAYSIAKRQIANNGTQCSFINNGKVKITEEEYNIALNVIREVNELATEIDQAIGQRRTKVTGLAWCMNVKGVNIERLKRIFRANYPSIRPVVSGTLFLADISDLYNKGLSKDKKIVFDALYRQEG